MATFEETKAKLIVSAKLADACKEGFTKLKEAKTWFDLCVIARESFEWCIDNDLLTPELMTEHCKDCNNANLYCNENVTNGFVLATGNSEIDVHGHCLVVAKDNSIVHAYDTSYVIAKDHANIMCWDSTRVHAEGYALVTAYNHSVVDVEKGTSAAVEAFDSSIIFASEDTSTTLNDSAKVIYE